MQVHSEPDGRLGLTAAVAAAVAGQPYQVAILDMKMPEMDGLTLAAAIKREPTLSQLPLIMLTSLHSEREGATARDLGIGCYLTKPVRRLDLYRQIAESLRRTVSAAADGGETTPAWPPLRGRVLLAEDNPVNQAVAQNMIEAIGCDLSIVANGAQAVEAIGRIALRSGAHGLPDARDGRLRGDGRDPQHRGGPARRRRLGPDAWRTFPSLP